MRRVLLLLLCCVVLTLAGPGVQAANSLSSSAEVAANGSCQMAVQLELVLDKPVQKLVIPLGAGAENASVNGNPVKIRKVDGMPAVVLEQEPGFTGAQSMTVRYTLRDCVGPKTEWNLQLPILPEGLDYPIEKLTFQVTLPGAFSQTPVFSSGYYGEDIDNYMTVSVTENVISGSVDVALRDRETLTMTMHTDPELFPRWGETGATLRFDRLAMALCALAALLYWVLRLRWRPVSVTPQTQVPVGVGAGEVGSRLKAQSPDLALMAVAWAQMGYITIHVSQERDVTLHKRMDMGNERSSYENKVFQAVFGRGQLVDAGGLRFQRLREQVDASRPRVRGQFTRRSGNPFWLRLMGASAGLFAGIGVGDLLLPVMMARALPLALFAAAGAAGAWLIQGGPRGLLSWNRRPGLVSGGVTAGYLLLGLLAGCGGLVFLCCLLQFVVGGLIVFGGQRSDAGRQTVQSILGFRRYLRTVDRKQLRRILSRNSGYYYDMAPYALALGVDRRFASRFETIRLPACPWLVTDFPQGNRAEAWYPLLREITAILRGKLPRLPRGQRERAKVRRRPAAVSGRKSGGEL